MSHHPQPCPFCDGRGTVRDSYNAIWRCRECNGRGYLRNGTLPGIEPAPPPPTPKQEKQASAGQERLF